MSSLAAGHAVAEVQAPSQRTFRGMAPIMWSASIYSALTMKGAMSEIPSKFQDAMHSAVLGTCFHFLGEAFGEQYAALFGIACAMGTTLVWTYLGGNTIALVGNVLVVALCGFPFCVCAFIEVRRQGSTGEGPEPSESCKLFTVTTLILKSFLKHGTVHMAPANVSSIVLKLPEALFSMSFLLNIMALWLAGAGVEILNPFRAASYSFAPNRRSSIVASTLYWTGTVIVVAYVGIIMAISTSDTPVIAKVACAVFIICTIVIVFKMLAQARG